MNEKKNSNPCHYILKFILTSQQKYNSKFQKFETVRTLKIQTKTTKFGPKKFRKINHYEKPKKRRKEKRKQPSKTKIVFFLYFESSNGFEFLKF